MREIHAKGVIFTRFGTSQSSNDVGLCGFSGKNLHGTIFAKYAIE